jgi:tripartite-type tricarboxylate transporter receptor subunit TctC
MFSRRLMLLTLSVLATIGMDASALAQSYPTRPITLVVPFTAGAVTDIVGRFLAQKLTDALGQPVVVENRAGAGGIVGAASVVRARPDGYTLLLASTSVVHGPLLQKTPMYDSRTDFTPVAAVLQAPFLLAVNASFPAKNVAELVAYVKANPGKINVASLGGFADAPPLMFIAAAHLDVQIVDYPGVPEAVMGVMRNDAQMTMAPYASIQGQVESEQLRMLAVTADRRSPLISKVPTFAEAGLPEVVLYNVVGVVAPANTPKPIVDRLNLEIAKIVKSEAGRSFITSRGNDEVEDLSAEHYAVMLKDVGDKYKRAIEEFGMEKR